MFCAMYHIIMCILTVADDIQKSLSSVVHFIVRVRLYHFIAAEL